MEEVVFTINGREYKAQGKKIPLDTTLNTFIRNHAGLFGTKFMCLEGGCGVCNVVVTERHPVTNEVNTYTVNSCLVPIYSCHGLDITTIEGVGNKDQYDRTQTRLVLYNGVQCGYCSPGMVMSMYGLLKSKNNSVTMEDVEKSFGGNICRCTGYRPILEGYKSLASDAPSQISTACKDIEDLKICKKTGSKCKEGCSSLTKRGLATGNIKISFNNNQQWNRVSSVSEIFEVFNAIGDSKYMLVSGNTAHGVYRRDPGIQTFIDISNIDQLRSYSSIADLEIGANMTLTEIMELFKSVGSAKPEFAYLLEINKHLEQVANVPVRNIATIAGNLMMKHAHHDFESDLYLILDVIGATLTVAESGNILSPVQLKDFLGLDMSKRVITKIVFAPRSDSYVYRSYKISPRAQNSAAYVNAAFLFEFNAAKTIVQSARIGYGGINANFTRASATEIYLVGKNLFTNATLQEALDKLNDEIEPEFQPPQSSAEYRKGLALSLFYRFVINTSPTDAVTPQYASGGSLLDRGLSTGSQSFQTQPERYPLSLSMHRVDGFVQAGGETPFSNDLPPQPNELWAAIVHATKVHATIGKIDASAALAVTGVVAFYSAADIPGLNSFTATQLPGLDYNEKIFENDRVIYHGQPVGVILAETQSLAEYAATLVQISYTNVSSEPVLPTIQSVFTANATDRIIERSDFNFHRSEEGTDVAHNIKGTFEVGSQFHFTMEPQTCIATPSEDGLNIWVSTQWLNLIGIAVSKCTNIPENRLSIECRRIGGGFGGKQSRSSFGACVAALSCALAKRPVRVVLTVESNMKALGKRYPCYGEYDVDVSSGGKIQKLYQKYYSDHGCTLNDPVEILATQWFQNCYDPRTYTIEANAIKTDTPSNTYMRGPGTCEGLAMIENIMDHIAYSTGVDPVEVRLNNMVDDHPIKLKFPEFLNWCEYTQRKAAVATFNAANRWKKRGLAIVPMQYPQNFFGHFPALVSIYHGDGTVAISHGGIEMGQGVSTKACQVAAHTLGIPVQRVAIKPTNNLISPNSAVSGGSVVSASVCYAVLKACEELNENIKPVRDEFPDDSWEEIIFKCNERSIGLSSLYFQTFKDLTDYLVYGISCAEVEVDILSGSFNITRVDILEDVGESISPLMDVGQVEGAFVQGLGMWLSEQLIHGSDGELLTNRTWNYHPPGALDIPVDIRIQFVKDSPNPDSVFRTKIAGEPPICMSVVGMYALRNALLSARQDAGLSGVWFDIKAPYTVEKIFLNAGTNHTQFTF